MNINRSSSSAILPVSIALLLLGYLAVWPNRQALAQSGNAIVVENSNPGTPGWLSTTPARNHEIEGYASRVSAAPGDSVSLYVNTTAPTYTVSLFRLGWYGGAGARLMAQYGPYPGYQQVMPTANPATGFLECSWQNPISVTIGNWTTGSYIFRLERPDGLQSYIPLVVRAPSSASALLFSCSVNTYQAYNQWGGESLYASVSGGTTRTHAFEVSFDRPYDTYDWNGPGAGHALLWEYPAIRWLEKQGYDISYTTDVDTHENGAALLSHRVFLSGGHDEYWTRPMYDAVQSARDSGVSLMFLGANACYWQVRTDASPLGADRRIIGYKDYAYTNDPDYGVTNALVTTTWRDPLLDRPENALEGVMYNGYMHIGPYQPMDLTLTGDPEFTGIQAPVPQYAPCVMGYEYDVLGNNGATPPGLEVLSTSPLVDATTLPAVSSAARYTAPSGARVFASGSIGWSWGLDGWQSVLEGRGDTTSPATQQLMTKLLTDSLATPAPTGATPLAQVTRVFPQTCNLAPGGGTDLQVAVGGHQTAPVVWSIISGGSIATVSQTGGVQISQAATNGAQVVVKATSTQYPSQSATATITVQIPQSWQTTFFAGTYDTGNTNGKSASALFDTPEGIAVDPQGNVYVADEENAAIRKISGGQVTTLAGSATATIGFINGSGAAARFSHPSGLAYWNGSLIVADAWNHAIRLVTTAGAVTTLTGTGTAGHVDGLLSQAQFNLPSGLAVAPSGYIYVADTLNHCIRSISPDGVVATVAGTGQPGLVDGALGTSQLYFPYGLAWTNAGLIVADSGNHAIRLLNSTNVLTTLAGTGAPGYLDGPAAAAQFTSPSGVFATPSGLIWIADHGNNVIRSLDPVLSTVSTVLNCGANGQQAGGDLTSMMNAPVQIVSNTDGSLLVSDNSAIYRTTPIPTATGLASVSILPNTVPGTLSATGLVTLNGTAPVATVVNLSTTNAAASVPTSVTVPTGASSQSFPITTQPVTQVVTGNVTGTLGGAGVNAYLSVRPIAPRTLYMNVTTLTGGQSTTATVFLEAPTPTAQVVNLTSSNPNVPVPASVTIAAGAQSQTFTITTNPVPAPTVTQITASANGRSDMRTLTVVPPSPATLVVNPYTAIGTETTTATLTLNGTAAGNVVVALSTNNSAVTLPGTVTVAAGSDCVNFTIGTQFVTASTAGFVYASSGGVTANAYIVVRPIGPASFTLTPTTLIGGQSSTAAVALETAAPTDTVVAITTSSPIASMPASITIPAGSLTGGFTISTQPVSVSTVVTLSATANGRPTQKTLTVNPGSGPIPLSLSVAPSSVIGPTTATGTLTLNTAPTTPLLVSLSSTVTAATPPATVTVPTGATTATFAIAAQTVASTSSGSITAKANSVSVSGAITVTPPAPAAVTLTPATVSGAQASTGTVTLTAKALTAVTVTLTSSNPTVAAVPATVVIPAGASTQTFAVTTTTVAGPTTVTVTATANGRSAAATLTLSP